MGKINKNKEENEKPKNKCVSCGTKSPGPKYKLKTLVGYSDHCQSKHRNPAYTIGIITPIKLVCRSPGPKYFYPLPGKPEIAFPKAVTPKNKECSPGPKYTLPGFSSPAFTIVDKPKYKCTPPTPGPYPAPPVPPGPAYTIGLKAKDRKCDTNPPIRGIFNKECIPAFSIVFKAKVKEYCRSPGPKYYPKPLKKSPAYTFGMKYSECVTVPRTECDELC